MIVRPQYRYAAKLLGFSPSLCRSPSHSWYGRIGERISLCLSGEIAQDLGTMKALFNLTNSNSLLYVRGDSRGPQLAWSHWRHIGDTSAKSQPPGYMRLMPQPSRVRIPPSPPEPLENSHTYRAQKRSGDTLEIQLPRSARASCRESLRL